MTGQQEYNKRGIRYYAGAMGISGFWYRFCIAVIAGFMYTGAYAQQELSSSVFEYKSLVSVSDTDAIKKIINEAYVLQNEGRYTDSAIILLNRSIWMSGMAGYNFGLARSLFHLGFCYLNKGDYPQAVNAFKKCLVYAAPENFVRLNIPNVYNSLANTYRTMGQYDSAIFFYYKILTVSMLLRDKMTTAGAYNNLGVVFIEFNQPERARQYLVHAEDIAVKNQYYDLLARIYLNMSTVADQMKDTAKKESYMQMSLTAAKGGKHKSTQRFILTSMGHSYNIRKEYDKARMLLEQAVGADDETTPTHKMELYIKLAEACIGTEDYLSAEQYLHQADKHSEMHKIQAGRSNIALLLSEIYKHTRRFEDALEQYQTYVHIKDSLQKGTAFVMLQRMDQKYLDAEKEKELAQKQLLIHEQKRVLDRQYLWIVIACSGIVILAIIIFTQYRSTRQKQKLHKQQLRTLKQETEIVLLQAIMKGEEKQRIRFAQELHDGISSQLAAIKILIGRIRKSTSDAAMVPELQIAGNMLNTVSDDVRKTAHNLMPDGLIRQGLPDATRAFCEQISQSCNLAIELHTYGDFNNLERNLALLIYRTIQELIQNIIKHAKASHVMILLTNRQDTLYVSIEDNGVGMATTVSEEEDGLGLLSLENRIHALGGTMIVESVAGKGTSVYIEISGVGEKLNISPDLVFDNI